MLIASLKVLLAALKYFEPTKNELLGGFKMLIASLKVLLGALKVLWTDQKKQKNDSESIKK